LTAYFNPFGYRRRLANYRVFRKALPIPLVTVELARSAARLELGAEDADILLQRIGEDCLWQKERLLNLALRALPADCDRIAWLDCDLIFDGSDWAAAIHDTLDRFPIAQAFHNFYELGADVSPQDVAPAVAIGGGVSIAYRLAAGDKVEEIFAPGLGNRLQRAYTGGLAWAARRALLDRHGFYDTFVIGGGDKAILSAALGRYEYVWTLEPNESQMEHYLRWARPFFADVQGQIGYVAADVYHQWHGDLRLRKYRDRHRGFRRFDFDPAVDIALDASGCWRWNSDKPEMHSYVRDYLASRREDG
jgi:hypothetical protein